MNRTDRYFALRFVTAAAATLLVFACAAAGLVVRRGAAVPLAWIPYLCLPISSFLAAIYSVRRSVRLGEWLQPVLAGRPPIVVFRAIPCAAVALWLGAATLALPTSSVEFAGARDARTLRCGQGRIAFVGDGLLVSGEARRKSELRSAILVRSGHTPLHMGRTQIQRREDGSFALRTARSGIRTVALQPARPMRRLRRRLLATWPLTLGASLHVVHLMLCVLLPILVASLPTRPWLATSLGVLSAWVLLLAGAMHATA